MKDNTKWVIAVLIVLSMINWIPVYVYYTNLDRSSSYSAHAELQSQALLDMQQDLWDFEYNVERALNSSIGDMTDRINLLDAEITQLKEEIRYYPACESELWLRHDTLLREYKDLEDRFHSMGEQYTYQERMFQQELSRLEHLLDIAEQIYDSFREKGYVIYVDPEGSSWGVD